MRNIDEFLCHFFILVKNRVKQLVKILVIELDPWVIRIDEDKKFTAEILNTSDIKIPEHLSFTELRKAEYLIGNIGGRENMSLLLQFETEILNVALSTNLNLNDMNQLLLGK